MMRPVMSEKQVDTFVVVKTSSITVHFAILSLRIRHLLASAPDNVAGFFKTTILTGYDVVDYIHVIFGKLEAI